MQPPATEELLDEPHVEGRRVSVLQLRDAVEEVGRSPVDAAEGYALDVAAVYRPLAYYHEHPEQMAAVRERRDRELDELQGEIAAERPEGVTPPSYYGRPRWVFY